MNNNVTKKNLYFWAYIFTSKILALIVFIVKYDLLKPSIEDVPGGITKKYKVSIWIIIALIWFLISFWESTTIFIRDMKEGFFRELMHSISSILLPLVLWISGVLAYYFIKDYLFFTGTILVTSMLGIYFKAKHNHFRRKVLIDRGYVNVLQ